MVQYLMYNFVSNGDFFFDDVQVIGCWEESGRRNVRFIDIKKAGLS